MAWTAPKTWVALEDVSAAEMNTHVRDNLNETAPAIASAAGRMIVTDGANSIVERIPTVDQETGSEETTASTSYTDLATAGPAVTVTTGTTALVHLHGRIRNGTGGQISFMGFAVSGSTTVAAADSFAIQVYSEGVNQLVAAGTTFLITGLTAGSNTFTAKYKVDAGTGKYAFRRLAVVPL